MTEGEEPIGVVMRRGFAGSIEVEMLDSGDRVIMWEGKGNAKVRVIKDDYGVNYVYANPKEN